MRADVLVIGAGFGGSIMALVLKQVGLAPVLVDRGTHPRFAIGESSTPIADFTLRKLARQHDLPVLELLSSYGSWTQSYPKIQRGLKRGFSYFQQSPGKHFASGPNHENELLAAASSSDEHADTHWLRSDADAFLAEQVQAAGIPFFDALDYQLEHQFPGWVLKGRRSKADLYIHAPMAIDASGSGGAVLKAVGVSDDSHLLRTKSRTLFGHFQDVATFRDYLLRDRVNKSIVADHPFHCDHAAQHHLLDEGWMWQLRFDNGVTSAGFVLDDSSHTASDAIIPPSRQWQELLQTYPALSWQFRDAQLVAPAGGIQRTTRLQRLASKGAEADWAALPHTIGFVDPLHSTGIAHTLCGIAVLADAFQHHWEKVSLTEQLERYQRQVRQELMLVDQLVSGCYQARRSFRLFAAYSMLYFAAATTYERRAATNDEPPAFLLADDQQFFATTRELHRELSRLVSQTDLHEVDVAAFEREVTDRIAPYNHVGLCDPSARNMYGYTAAPADNRHDGFTLPQNPR